MGWRWPTRCSAVGAAQGSVASAGTTADPQRVQLRAVSTQPIMAPHSCRVRCHSGYLKSPEGNLPLSPALSASPPTPGLPSWVFLSHSLLTWTTGTMGGHFWREHICWAPMLLPHARPWLHVSFCPHSSLAGWGRGCHTQPSYWACQGQTGGAVRCVCVAEG